MADRPESSDRVGGANSNIVLTSSGRPRSPARHSDRSPEHRSNHRNPSQPSSSNHRRKSRERHHQDSHKGPMDVPSGPGQAPDLIPRFREQQARESEAEHRSSSRRSRSRERERHGTPSSYKRHRSRSYSPSSHRKRSRRDRSSSRHNRDRVPNSDSKHRRPRSPHHGDSSSHRHGRSYKSSGRSDRPRSRSRSRYQKDSNRSPHDSSRRPRRDSKDTTHSRRERRSHSRSRSPERGLENTGGRHSRDRSDRGYSQPKHDDGVPRATSRSDVDDDRASRDSQHRSRGASPSSGQGMLHPSRNNQKPGSHYDDGNKEHSNGNSLRPPSPSKQTPISNRNESRGGFRGVPISSRGAYRDGEHFNSQRQSPSRGSGAPGEPMDLDNRPPATPKPDPPKNAPSGPASSKFSFAFKATSKPTGTPPKPEISQRFNALPQRRDNQFNQRPPHDAPTQPASHKQDHTRPPEGPRMAPRMRKVKKIMKKLKPRPTLPVELVNANSVFHRKPGNESVVGSGTYGKVFKALNVYTKDQVALKRIRMEGEKDGFPVTAIREIKLLQSLRHVNIVNLQEVMVEKNDCFMVFEYLSHDLTGILNHPSFKLEAPQKKDLARQLFEGLDYLHLRGVLHRDIKAANILVSKDGILKIADFGLARFYAKRHQLEYTNRVITIWYRSPELLLGETKYTAAVDVWSAACVMMEIFTGSATFPGDGTELSQLEKIYSILGTPNRHEWPGLVDLAWFELLRPTVKKKSIFTEKFKALLTPAAFELMESMFHYDPEKRPSAGQILQHAYFTTEEPVAKQAVELATIGEWHEFESKALRKEKERRERDVARKAAAAAKNGAPDVEKKVAPDTAGQEAKVVQ